MKDPKDIVREGYNRVSFAYREDNPDKSKESFQNYKAWTDEIAEYLNEGDSVLDLGCGCGVPSTKLLSEKFDITGADISPVQIDRARKLVQNAKFICGDMCQLEFQTEQFDAIVCFYAIIHVPVAEQKKLLSSIWGWLKPSGNFLFSAGESQWTGEEKDWLGVKNSSMYWSHADRNTYIQWLKEIGFTIVWDRFVPEDKSGHSLILARKNENR